VIIQTTNEQEAAHRETIHCPNCRMVCDANLNFCGRCGQRLRGTAPAQQTGAVPPLRVSSAAHRRLPFVVMLCVCILSVLFAIGAGTFASIRSLATRSTPLPSVSTLVTKPEGTAWFYDVRGQDDNIEMYLTALPQLKGGLVYVGWLVNPYRPDQVLAVGPIIPDHKGTALVQSDQMQGFNGQAENLRRIFPRVVVTLEKAGEQWQKPGNTILMQGNIDQTTSTTLSPLFVRSAYTPKQTSLLVGLHTQTRGIARWMANMTEAQQRNDVATVRADLLRLLYLLEGTHGPDVARLNVAAQQNIVSAGDGVGVLSANAACKQEQHTCGYLDMLRATVQTLMTQQRVPQAVAQKVLTTLTTMKQLAQHVQQVALDLVTLNKLDAATVQKLTTLAVGIDTLLNGSDHDGDGSIDPVPGEAATAQLYGYAQQLGAIRLT